jgi:hypothetical protein
MMAWLATEGGRKCPQCGKYAKEAELGYTGGLYEIGGVLTHISSYGHLPGYGCNRPQNDALSGPRGGEGAPNQQQPANRPDGSLQ